MSEDRRAALQVGAAVILLVVAVVVFAIAMQKVEEDGYYCRVEGRRTCLVWDHVEPTAEP